MPWGDNTGPLGMGPMTGRGLGYCAGYGAPGYTQPFPGRGFGRGRGRGFGPGFGRGFAWRGPAYPGAAPYPTYQSMTSEQEKQMLQNEAQQLKQALTNIENRLADLEEKAD
jgi:hypothetical protein